MAYRDAARTKLKLKKREALEKEQEKKIKKLEVVETAKPEPSDDSLQTESSDKPSEPEAKGEEEKPKTTRRRSTTRKKTTNEDKE